MGYLDGKRILFIQTGFHDYEDAICSVMRREGAEVNCLISPCRNIYTSILRHINLHQEALNYENRKRQAKIKATSKQYDLVFIIKGECLTQKDIDLLKSYNPKARFILYLWDSLVRHENKNLLLDNFSEIWSFDRLDCEENSRLRFRPLFYREIPLEQKKIYSLSFIGWMHSDRLVILRELRSQLNKNGEKYFLKLYMTFFRFLYERYIERKIGPSDMEFIILRPVKYKNFQNILAQSLAVLDIAHPMQSGLTMRSIEVLSAKCHLITTNSDITSYKNIPQSSYTVFDRNNVIIPKYKICESSLSDYYSLEYFVKEIIMNNNLFNSNN